MVIKIYLYRRKGCLEWATCNQSRFIELSSHNLFETKIVYDELTADQYSNDLHDANRYRYLRDKNTRDGLDPEAIIVVGCVEGDGIFWSDQLDQAVDAMMETLK